MKRLLVMVPDYITAILEKGEYQPNYYNPGEVFDEVHLLLTNPDKPDIGALQRTVGRAKLYLHNLPENYYMPYLPWSCANAWWLKRWAAPAVALAERIKPDMIRCHGADMNTYAARQIHDALGIPYVVSLHINADINPTRRVLTGNPSWRQWRVNTLFEYVERAGLHKAALVMPVYAPIIPYLERMGVERYRVCYNVLNGDHLRAKTDYQLKGRLKLICVGRLFEDKNPTHIISAVAALENVELTIVGDGPLRPALEAQVRALKLEQRVKFSPAIANDVLCAQLPEYDAFVLHTEYWEINKSLLEGLLTGLPVVMNHRKGLPVPELEGDFLHKVENSTEAYREAIARLRDDHAWREGLGRKAYQHAQAHWSPAVTEAVVVDIYERAMRGEALV